MRKKLKSILRRKKIHQKTQKVLLQVKYHNEDETVTGSGLPSSTIARLYFLYLCVHNDIISYKKCE